MIIHVENETGPNKVHKAAQKWCDNPGSVLQFNEKHRIEKTVFFRGKDPTYMPGAIVGSLVWDQLDFVGNGQMFHFYNFKDGSIRNLKFRVPETPVDNYRTGMEFYTDGSSARVEIENVRAQGFSTGFYCNAPNGADMCQYEFSKTDGFRNDTTFKFNGSNNLDADFIKCASSEGQIGWDMKGGSNFLMLACSGSLTKEWVKVRGGFPFIAIGGRTEDCDVPYTIGGDDYDGYGQVANCSINDIVHRGVRSVLAKVNKAGHTGISVLDTANGNNVVELTNKSGQKSTFTGFNVTPKTIEGDWNVNAAGAILVK